MLPCRAAEDVQLNQDVGVNGGSLRRGNGFAVGVLRDEHGLPTSSPQTHVLADSEAGSHAGMQGTSHRLPVLHADQV